MIARLRRSLSFSNVIACLALFVALGGSVYAAGKISGKQIRPRSLPGNRIKPKSIQPNRIKPNSLSGRQINEKTLTGVSAAALAEVQYQATTTTLPSDGRRVSATANCPPDTYVIGGGVTLSNENQANVNGSGPSALRTGWTATAYSYWWFGPGPTMTVTAICVVVEKPRGAANNVHYEPAG